MQSSARRSAGLRGAACRASQSGAATTAWRCGLPSGAAIMSRGTRSAGRMPRSKPAAPISTSRPSVTTATCMRGQRRRNSSSSGAIWRPAAADALMRTRPDGVSCCALAPAIAARITSSAGPTCSVNCRPASLSDTLRVVRLKSRTPRPVSSRAIRWESAVVEMPRSCAAARNDPRRAMASTASNPFSPVSAIVPILSSPDVELSRLSYGPSSAMFSLTPQG